eukprot:13218344-Alexandrium_andersonii.AAC.1
MDRLMTDDIFAGRSGRGAADAWHSLSLAVERARVLQQPLALVAFDLFKAFDQLNRWTIYSLMACAGVPACVLLPYLRFMESLSVVGVFRHGIGKPTSRKEAIPQGCPFSMLGVALYLLPWTRMVRQLHEDVVPRVLADDMLLGIGLGEQCTADE